ncbi:MAG: Hsp20/alpha crystallin family protein [bacterium]
MGTERWDLNKEIAEIYAEINRIFESFFKRTIPIFEEVAFVPQVNMFKENNNLIAEIALPGVKKEDINLSLEDKKLVISGTRIGRSDRIFYMKEFQYGNFERKIEIDFPIKEEDIRAEYNDGILKVSIPLMER